MNLNKLHRLVQSLDQKERSRFSKRIGKEKDVPKYIELYKILRSETLTPTDELKRRHKNSSDDLVKHIFACLRDDSHKHKEYEDVLFSKKLKNLMLIARLLFNKGLYDICWDILVDAKKKAIEIYQFSTVLEINRLMTDVLLLKRDLKHSLRNDLIIDELYTELVDYTAQLLEYSKHKKYYAKLLFKSRRKINNHDIETIKEEYQGYIKTSPKSPLAVHRYYQACAIYYQLIGNIEEASKMVEKALHWWEKSANVAYLKEDKYRYLLTITNFIHYLLRKTEIVEDNEKEQLYIKIDNYIEKIKNSSSVDKQVIVAKDKSLLKIKIAYLKIALSNAIRKQDFKEGTSLIMEIQKVSNSKKSKVRLSIKDKKVFFSYYIHFYFIKTDYSACFREIKSFLNLDKRYPEIRKDLYLQVLPFIILAKIAIRYKRNTPLLKECTLSKINTLIKKTQGVFVHKDPSYYKKFFELIVDINSKIGSSQLIFPVNEMRYFIRKNKRKDYAEETMKWLTIFSY